MIEMQIVRPVSKQEADHHLWECYARLSQQWRGLMDVNGCEIS
jgi:hypothetical protein